MKEYLKIGIVSAVIALLVVALNNRFRIPLVAPGDSAGK